MRKLLQRLRRDLADIEPQSAVLETLRLYEALDADMEKRRTILGRPEPSKEELRWCEDVLKRCETLGFQDCWNPAADERTMDLLRRALDEIEGGDVRAKVGPEALAAWNALPDKGRWLERRLLDSADDAEARALIREAAAEVRRKGGEGTEEGAVAAD